MQDYEIAHLETGHVETQGISGAYKSIDSIGGYQIWWHHVDAMCI